eukprot:scaffold2201_cov240-Pinguiococcus_pyrenoidosus.AAC.12
MRNSSRDEAVRDPRIVARHAHVRPIKPAGVVNLNRILPLPPRRCSLVTTPESQASFRESLEQAQIGIS